MSKRKPSEGSRGIIGKSFLGLRTKSDGTKNQIKESIMPGMSLPGTVHWQLQSQHVEFCPKRQAVGGQAIWMLKENCVSMTEIMGAFFVLEIFIEISRAGLFAQAAEELWIQAVSLWRMEKADRKTPGSASCSKKSLFKTHSSGGILHETHPLK